MVQPKVVNANVFDGLPIEPVCDTIEACGGDEVHGQSHV